MSASAVPSGVHSPDHSISAPQPPGQQPKSAQRTLSPSRVTPLPRARSVPIASHAARGESISLARRAAAVAKKKREHARAEFERQGYGSDLDSALRTFVSANAATRPNVSQNKAKRQKRIKWTPQEVDALRCGVQKYGEGRWAVILRENADLFNPVRISVDLKDKWRNLSKSAKTSDKHHQCAATSPTTQSTPISTPAPVLSPPLASLPLISHVPAPIRLPSTGPSIPPLARASERLSTPSLPAIQVHPSQTQRSLLNSNRFSTDITSSMADVRRTPGLPHLQHVDNLPVFPFSQFARSRPMQESNEAVRNTSLTAFHLHSSPSNPRHHSVEPRPISMPLQAEHKPMLNAYGVPTLAGGALHDTAYARPVEERIPSHAHHTQGARADHRPSEVVQHSSGIQSLPSSHSQPFHTISQSHASPAIHLARDAQGALVAPQRIYDMNREEDLPHSRTLNSPTRRRHLDRSSDSAQFRYSHSLKDRVVCEPSTEIPPFSNNGCPSEDLSSRFPPIASVEPHQENHHDAGLPRLSRPSMEEFKNHERESTDNPYPPQRRNLRDIEIGARSYRRNSASQSLDDDMHHLRSSNSENRFTHHQSEDGQYQFSRAAGNNVRFGQGQTDSDSNRLNNSSQSGSRFGPDDEDMTRNSLDHSGGNMHIGIGDQAGELVRTGEGIHNEDPMHQVEPPREVLDNDEDDEQMSHLHSDPNESNLYHGSDEGDDQLDAHHPFSLGNDNVGNPDDGDDRDNSHALGLSDNHHGLHIQTRLDEGSRDCYATDRSQSPLPSDQDRQYQNHQYGSHVRVGKPRMSRHGEESENERGGNMEYGRGQAGINESPRTVAENPKANNISKTVGNPGSTDIQSNDSFTGHEEVYDSRDGEATLSDRQGFTDVYDKNSDAPHFDSSVRERNDTGEVYDFSANGTHANESSFSRKEELKEDNNIDGNGLLENRGNRGIIDPRPIAINIRSGTRRGSFHPRLPSPAVRIQNGNEEEPTGGLQNRVPFEGRTLRANASSSDSSREFIPLVNPANSFIVTRIKSSSQGHDRAGSESHGATERELQATLRRGNSTVKENDDDIHQYSSKQNSMAGEGQHRVEAVASVASLLNPTTFETSSEVYTRDERQKTRAKDKGS